MKKCKTTEKFIQESKQIHGDKYDYSKVAYEKSSKKVCIICPKHGEFWQTPNDHLMKHGCPACANKANGIKKTHSKDKFIEKAQKIHGDKYDYSKVEYVNSRTKVCIICPEHGEFLQTPDNHINAKQGCPKCANINNSFKRLKEFDEFINKANEIHNKKYKYSKVKYIGAHKKICIICPEHGEFWQTPNGHVSHKNGCPICSKKNQDLKKIIPLEEWLKKAGEIHNQKYDYSKVEYKGCFEKVCIICPKHGEFWQIANSHLRGQGCPKCKNSVLENKVMNFLIKNNIKFEYQYYPNFLNNGIGHQSLDFYLPDYNVAIECQGMQHYRPVKAFGGEEQFKKQIERDKRKKALCEKNNIKLLYYSTYIDKDKYAISSLKKLLYEIRKF